jgi:hypothetical protein
VNIGARADRQPTPKERTWMTMSTMQLASALDKLAETISKADSYYGSAVNRGDDYDYDNARWALDLAYTQLIILFESLELPAAAQDVRDVYAKASKEMLKSESGPDGELYLYWAFPARRFQQALADTFVISPEQTVTRDVESIIRASTYAITDKNVYPAAPANEDDVHRRIEAILKCVFTDTLHKPRLAKAIKNFEPDTGIPSIKTLVQ